MIKNYPKEIHQIISRKLKLFELAENFSDHESTDTLNLKPQIALIIEMLNEIGIGTAHNDRTTICSFISCLTGNSEKNIYNLMQKGFFLSNFHRKQIEKTNAILKKLNSSISINMEKQY